MIRRRLEQEAAAVLPREPFELLGEVVLAVGGAGRDGLVFANRHGSHLGGVGPVS
jgi:hypothetical protein